VGVVKVAERYAPVSHAALRVGGGDVIENVSCGAVPERMLVPHSAIEPALRNLVAGNFEMDVAELLIGNGLCGSGTESRNGQGAGKDENACTDGTTLG
jgi:hypothetical protein